jgi:MarR family transcriptional regulator, organic hydroperoxide resistance regulator
MIAGKSKKAGRTATAPAKVSKSRSGTGKKPGASHDEIAVYQLQVITTILHILGNLRHSGMELLSEVELSYPQILVLYSLLEHGTLNVGELADQLKVSQGVVSRTVDRLVDKGLLDRVRDSFDRRVVNVTLSEEGRTHATKMISYHAERLERQFSETSPSDREVFLKMLRQIDSGLDESLREEAGG